MEASSPSLKDEAGLSSIPCHIVPYDEVAPITLGFITKSPLQLEPPLLMSIPQPERAQGVLTTMKFTP